MSFNNTLETLKTPNKKKKFVIVSPKTSIAKDRFIHIMDSFHSCEVKDETKDKLLLLSLNKLYSFWVQKEGNEHWEVKKK